MKKVVVLGASKKEKRYSNKAVKMLLEKNHEVFPINPAYDEIGGIKCYRKCEDITEKIDTVTVYVSEKNLKDKLNSIISLKPKRIILNPGTENKKLEIIAKENNIEVINACTLVMLSTGQF